MKTFSRILVPIDFLDHSAEAVRRAMDLAVQHSAEVILLHACEPGEYPLHPGDVVYDDVKFRQMTTPVRARLDAVRRDADPLGCRQIRSRVMQGQPTRAIVEAAKEEAVDLIVMGTHGRTGLGRAVLGSIAEQVVRRAPCPVLTIKAPRASAAAQLTPESAGARRWNLSAFLAPRWRHAAQPTPAVDTNAAASEGRSPPRASTERSADPAVLQALSRGVRGRA